MSFSSSMKTNRRSFVYLLSFVVITLLTSCGYPTHIDPPLLTYPTESIVKLSAEAHAKEVNGLVFSMLDTHSMEPLIKGGDYVVIEPVKRRPFDTLKAGEVIAYRADWYTLHPVVHRLVKVDGGGWVLSGDNVARSEAHWRVTEKTYLGVVVGIYRVKGD